MPRGTASERSRTATCSSYRLTTLRMSIARSDISCEKGTADRARVTGRFARRVALADSCHGAQIFATCARLRARRRPRAAHRERASADAAPSVRALAPTRSSSSRRRASPCRSAPRSTRFARRTGTVVQQENGASLELARRITELHRVPDVIALADEEVFPQLLVPRAASWYARFARNRMVLAYTDRSRGRRADHGRRTGTAILLRPDVRVGRSDPTLAPVGLSHARRLPARRAATIACPASRRASRRARRRALIRPNARELVALLQAGELDYIVDYESLARANHLRYRRASRRRSTSAIRRAPRSTRARACASRAGRDTRDLHRRADRVRHRACRATRRIAAAGARFLAFLLGAGGTRAARRARGGRAARSPSSSATRCPPALRSARR